MKKIFVYILTLFSLIVCMPLSNHRILAKTITEEFYNCSVTDQLENLEVPIDDYNDKVITMTQFYDKDKVLHSYVYVNDSLSSIGTTYYLHISTSTADSNGSIIEDVKSYQLSYIQHDVYDESTSSCYIRYEINDLPNLQYTLRRYYISGYGFKSLVNEVIDKVFIFHGIYNESLKVFNQYIETIEITEKEFAFYPYGNGQSSIVIPWLDESYMSSNNIYTDAWYVFFNTDKKIDSLKEVEMTYEKYDYNWYTKDYPKVNDNYTYSLVTERVNRGLATCNLYEPVTEIITCGKVPITSSSKGWFIQYSQQSTDLERIINLKESVIEIGEDKHAFEEQSKTYSWAFNFLNTEKEFNVMSNIMNYMVVKGSGVKQVAILKLKFITDGEEHNCYAIDIPTDDFTGTLPNKDKEPDLKFILTIIALALLYLILRPILKPIFKLVLAPFKLLFDKLLSIIRKPFKKRKRRK